MRKEYDFSHAKRAATVPFSAKAAKLNRIVKRQLWRTFQTVRL